MKQTRKKRKNIRLAKSQFALRAETRAERKALHFRVVKHFLFRDVEPSPNPTPISTGPRVPGESERRMMLAAGISF